jgi:hypothetical protein
MCYVILWANDLKNIGKRGVIEMTIYLPIQIGRLKATPTLNGNRQKKRIDEEKIHKRD